MAGREYPRPDQVPGLVPVDPEQSVLAIVNAFLEPVVIFLAAFATEIMEIYKANLVLMTQIVLIF